MPTKADCSCSQHGPWSTYDDGPTACAPHPKVIKNIKKQIAKEQILSVADARIAALSGMLGTPQQKRTGFNDGVIYPPDIETPPAGLALAAAAKKKKPRVSRAHALPTGPQTLNCLVLLVDFSDNKGTRTAAHYEKLLFDLADPNSMASFYKELSYGQLTVTGTVVPWIRASKSYGYYTDGASGTGDNYPRNTPGLLEEVLDKWIAAGGNSFKPFDVNGDGHLDGLFLIHAGPGAETLASPAARKNAIWSHKWTLNAPYKKNGVTAYAYFTAPEDGKLGVFSHEFGHFLGLPDLYDTTYRSYGIGDWCLMAGGSWNGNGAKPARMSAWCLERLEWMKPAKVTAAGTFTLDTLENQKADCYRIALGTVAKNEYILIENRQKAGRDSALPGHGLAVWHIDDTQSDNDNPLAYKVALVQADGRRDLELLKNEGDAGDVYPGSKGVTSVSGTSATHPHLRANNGAATTVSLTAISETGGMVKVKVKP
jgi:immune inhibitor A